jgi:hypothetical protein
MTRLTDHFSLRAAIERLEGKVDTVVIRLHDRSAQR